MSLFPVDEEQNRLFPAVSALEIFALSTGQFDASESAIKTGVPWPSSVVSGLGGPESACVVLDDLVARLTLLRATWVDR